MGHKPWVMAIASKGDNRMAKAFSSFASAATRRHLALLYDYWKELTSSISLPYTTLATTITTVLLDFYKADKHHRYHFLGSFNSGLA